MFDEIPGNNKEEHPCQICGKGNIKLNLDKTSWECDSCDFKSVDTEVDKN